MNKKVLNKPTFNIERTCWKNDFQHVAGVDEVGRGCLAGPVVAAAVILPKNFSLKGIHDSKQLSTRQRSFLLPQIREKAISVGIGTCSPEEIDQLNILHASMEAMRRATKNLVLPPDFLLIDGNRCFPNPPWPFKTVVKGDQKCLSIAAASIVAKEYRDNLMKRYNEKYPGYCWHTNVGYPTRAHYDALQKIGPSPLHRKTFRLA